MCTKNTQWEVYTWKFIPFDHLHPFPPSPISPSYKINKSWRSNVQHGDCS